MTPEEVPAFVEKLKSERKERIRIRKNEVHSQWRLKNKDRVKEYWAKQRFLRKDKRKEYYTKRRDELLDYNRWNHIKLRFGITEAEWEAKFEEQGRCCAVCKSTSHNGRNWCVDHCHKTGVIRGILCNHCNVTVANHSAEHLRKCADYVEKWLKLNIN